MSAPQWPNITLEWIRFQLIDSPCDALQVTLW
jgi:hypothetical protein